MEFVRKTMKQMFIDLLSMGKGFVYGFVMVGLFIIIGGALLYGVLFIRNLML
ncbi:hypothetical protein [Halobacillus sp. BBL2006]|uniref:hypothetical protein n=1 Tax=Halobacillus sp. BBL2006 TaxID=1543706 RepID=UPI000A600A5C|nr:hypothetical protein [Halobacillus sp. BBL2006]